jgi:DNA-directed RNA polymerase sigma subunit (sigma70/sigma32)
MCNLKQQEVELLMQKMSNIKVLSLDHVYGASSDDRTQLYGDAALRTEDDYAETLQMKEDVVSALSRNLDGREALLLRLRYGLTKDGKTRSLVECAQQMGISRSRAQQLASQSLQKLREAEDISSLREYLYS